MNIKERQKKQKTLRSGFTLIEIIIYVAIIIMVLASFTSFSTSISNNREKIYVFETVHDNARVVMEEVNKKVRASSFVVTPVKGTSGSTLTLSMPSGPNISFFLSGGSLKMQTVGVSTSTVNSQRTNMSGLLFTNLGAPGKRDSIRTDFTIGYYLTNGVTYTYSQTLRTVANPLK